MNHIISTKDFTRAFIKKLFAIADTLKENEHCLANKILASLFYEPSTRTRFSFESAMYRLGGKVIGTENAAEFSSASKGESLEDAIKIVGHYADIIILRHPQTGAAYKARGVSSVPIINAGDGSGEHPTQALLDLYTLYKELKTLSTLSIAFVGDLKNGRTVHSLVYLLTLFENITMYFVSPKQLPLPREITKYIKSKGLHFTETSKLASVLPKINALYQTRVQKERFIDPLEYVQTKDAFILTPELLSHMHADTIIMHPLPRNNEIPTSIDSDPRAAYFKQAKYGLRIRMALLKLLLM